MYHIIMDALYDFLPVPSANAEDTTPRLYPKIVSKGTVTFEKLTEQIANHSGLTKGTILAVMDEIEYWTAQLLSDGYRVQIGNIGRASQDHRLARPEQMDGSTPYRHRRTRAAPGVCEVRI